MYSWDSATSVELLKGQILKRKFFKTIFKNLIIKNGF